LIVQCDDVSKFYKGCHAVENLSFSIEENSITGVIGRNGAGKTTLLKMISGFYKPTSGLIRVLEENPFNNLKVSANTIFIDENMCFPKNLTLLEILKCAKSFYPNFNESMSKRLLEYFSLKENKKHRELSKGMRSTFNMIVGIASHCPLTIMDEPTTGMDAAVRKDFYKIILKDYIDHPRTIILSSHLLNEVEDILENILLMKDGVKCLHKPLIELKEYAIGLSGKDEVVETLVCNRKILYKEAFGKDSIYVVAETENYEIDIEAAKSLGIEVKAVSCSDLCIYLTSPKKGGINYVFSGE